MIDWEPITTAPMDSTPVLLWAKEFMDEDFNPSGVIDGYWSCDVDCGWIGAVWNGCQDCWDTLEWLEPSHWAPKTVPSRRVVTAKTSKLATMLLIALCLPSLSAAECVPNGWFADVGIAYNFDNPDNGQDFEGGRDLALFAVGREWDNNEIGLGHISHWFSGWPFHKDREEEEIDLYLFYNRRFRW